MQNLELHLFLWLTTLTSSSEGQALLKATLTMRDQRDPVYVGENVYLICNIEGGKTGWTYYWMKDHEKNWKRNNQNTMTFPSVIPFDSGQYWCTAYRDDFPIPVPVSTVSNVVTLNVRALSMATLRMRNQRDPLYAGERVTLICSIKGSYTDLTYYWMKDHQENWRKTNQNTMTIQSVTGSDSGQYQCTAYRDDLSSPVPVSTDSNAVTLRVHDYLKATLRLKDQRYPLYVGEDVTLICSIEGNYTRWTYNWRKGPQTDWRKSTENTMTIPSVTESDSGQYQCTAYKDGPTSVPVSTDSNVVKLRVHGPLKATLTLMVQREPVYIGDDVTLDCSIDGGHTGLAYQWFKDLKASWGKNNEDTVTISSVTVSDSGQYQCAAYRDGPPSPVHVSSISNAVTLRVNEVTTVKAPPSYKEVTTVKAPLPYKDLTTVKAPPSYKEVTTVKAPPSYKEVTTVKDSSSYTEMTTVKAPPSHKELSVENKVRLAISGLVLIVLLIIVAEFLWIRSNKAVSTSGQEESESNTNL